MNNCFSKKVCILCIYALLHLLGADIFSQVIPDEEIYYYSFEPNNDNLPTYYIVNEYELLEFDNSGLWQIGKPNKQEWDSAFEGSNVLITDTAHLIKEPIKSSFIFKYERPFYSNCLSVWDVEMAIRYELPINKAGLYFEVSYDKGANWMLLTNDSLPCFKSQGQTKCSWPYMSNYYTEYAINDIPAASGIKESWVCFMGSTCTELYKDWPSDEDAAKIESFWLKFNYINTDTVPHKGIIIDNLSIVVGHGCEFLSIETSSNNSNINIYPNPVKGQSVLSFDNKGMQEVQLQVFNTKGQLVLTEQTCGNHFIVENKQLKTGLHIYQLKSGNELLGSGRFVVE